MLKLLSNCKTAMAGPIVDLICFDHVTIVVKDLARSRNFYAGLLGVPEVPRPNFSFGGLWFQIGDQQIHLIEEHDRSGKAGFDPDGPRSSRMHHFAFRVPDAYAVIEPMRAAGVPIVSEPKSRPDGAIQVFVEDPDGHIVEFCSVP